MAIVDLIMPKMGESIMEATILKWHKKPGDPVRQDETVLDIATDKVDSEVPSTAEGTIEALLFNVGDVVPVGAVIARVRTSADVSPERHAEPDPEPGQPSPQTETTTAWKAPAANGAPPAETPVQPARPAAASNGNAGKFYSPLVLNIASNEGVSPAELETIGGTGLEGRVTKKDILDYVARRGRGAAARPAVAEQSGAGASSGGMFFPSAATESPASTEPQTAVGGNTEILEMDRMRKLIAEHMVRSKQTSPHVTSFCEADVTNLAVWREQNKAAFEKSEGTKLTLTPLFIEAVVRCIKKFPLINSSLQGDKIILRKDINIGMATALPSGNLIVPVIRNADNFNRTGLARQVNALAESARAGKLRPEDTQGGTFTVTNIGTFGSLMGTPIINQPQVAILAIGAIKKRPVVIETESGDTIGIRQMMYLSLSYDHRIVDGALGASFLSAVAKEIEKFVG